MVLNIVAIFGSATASFLSYPYQDDMIYLALLIIHISLASLFMIAVLLMRRAITQTSFAQPNDSLVIIHLINFGILILAVLILTIL